MNLKQGTLQHNSLNAVKEREEGRKRNRKTPGNATNNHKKKYLSLNKPRRRKRRRRRRKEIVTTDKRTYQLKIHTHKRKRVSEEENGWKQSGGKAERKKKK